MKKLILIAAFTLLTASVSSAQDYKWAIGGHFSVESGGVSVKHKFNTQNALEVLLLKPEWDDGFIVNVLYQRHVPVISHGFNFYYGFGGHIGEWDDDFAIGADAIIGLEYKVPSAPIAFSIGYKPILNIANDTKFILDDFSLGIRVCF